jgi:hypothetical protein
VQQSQKEPKKSKAQRTSSQDIFPDHQVQEIESGNTSTSPIKKPNAIRAAAATRSQATDGSEQEKRATGHEDRGEEEGREKTAGATKRNKGRDQADRHKTVQNLS